MENKQDFIYSYYTIRKIIGILGILLPILVYFFYGTILESISHYYYTRSAVFLIAILTAFGLFLISYRGYKREIKTEWLSDNAITHIGGFAALLIVLFPTQCSGSMCIAIDEICASGNYPLFGHGSPKIATIHFLSAGTFFTTMGYLSIYRFTKGEPTPEKLFKNKIYKTCGWIMWISIFILFVEFLLKRYYAPKYHTFIFESISITAFGISWLVKGEAIKDIVGLKRLFVKQ